MRRHHSRILRPAANRRGDQPLDEFPVHMPRREGVSLEDEFRKPDEIAIEVRSTVLKYIVKDEDYWYPFLSQGFPGIELFSHIG